MSPLSHKNLKQHVYPKNGNKMRVSFFMYRSLVVIGNTPNIIRCLSGILYLGMLSLSVLSVLSVPERTGTLMPAYLLSVPVRSACSVRSYIDALRDR